MLVLGTYETRRAAIHPWDPRVVEVAAALVARIRSVVPDLEPEHVGSTSIPGMPGKGYVDVDLLTAGGTRARRRRAPGRRRLAAADRRARVPGHPPLAEGARHLR